MPKKRKTRQEKIILQLKRELARNTKSKPRQEAKSFQPQVEAKKRPKIKKVDTSAFSYDLSLIRQDLGRSLLLTLGILSLEFVIYFQLR